MIACRLNFLINSKLIAIYIMFIFNDNICLKMKGKNMSVDGVNNVNINNNNALIATGTGAVVGAGAGIASAVMSKPYLNGVLPSDKFILKSIDNMAKSSNEDIKSLGMILKDVINTTKAATNHEDILKLVDKPIEKLLDKIPAEKFDKLLLKGKSAMEGVGESVPEQLKLLIENINTKQDLALIGKAVSQNAEIIPLAEIKNLGKNIGKLASSMILSIAQIFKGCVSTLTDNEKAMQEAIKSAASSITKMSALKYGGIGAVAAGGIGLAASMLASKENKAVETEKTV